MNVTKSGAVTASQRRAKHKRPETAITPAQALALLQSAMHYCQQAGLEVQCKADETLAGLVLFLPMVTAEATSNGSRFVLKQMEA